MRNDTISSIKHKWSDTLYFADDIATLLTDNLSAGVGVGLTRNRERFCLHAAVTSSRKSFPHVGTPTLNSLHFMKLSESGCDTVLCLEIIRCAFYNFWVSTKYRCMHLSPETMCTFYMPFYAWEYITFLTSTVLWQHVFLMFTFFDTTCLWVHDLFHHANKTLRQFYKHS
jgi:hypothetical protein